MSVGGVTALANGHYVVSSPGWNSSKGAVTWGNGNVGTRGTVSEQASLVGARIDDSVGSDSVVALTNGNYVVASALWDKENGTENVGAVTWCKGAIGCTGLVSGANSLVGRNADDGIGDRITALANGHYVVLSREWDAPPLIDVGAITWGNGASGTIGEVDGDNSRLGRVKGDLQGAAVTALVNGNYVVACPYFNGARVNAEQIGAVTWARGDQPSTGDVSSANALVGSQAGDGDGSVRAVALTNGHYVAAFPAWSGNSGVSYRGAVAWGNGDSGTTGLISTDNALVGASPSDNVGSGGVVALANGNYVVGSPAWSDGATTGVGAVTWQNGSGPAPGVPPDVVSRSNSLIGSSPVDVIGSGNSGLGNPGIIALRDGNYVVSSPFWDDPMRSNVNAGAATWMDGSQPSGNMVVSETNSLIGTGRSNQYVSNAGVVALPNGHHVVASPAWEGPVPFSSTRYGAVTWRTGQDGGEFVSALASWTSDSASAPLGKEVHALDDGRILLVNRQAPCGTVPNCGIVAIRGEPSGGELLHPGRPDTVTGLSLDAGPSLQWSYNAAQGLLVVGNPVDNVVTVLGDPPEVFADGFESP